MSAAARKGSRMPQFEVQPWKMPLAIVNRLRPREHPPVSWTEDSLVRFPQCFNDPQLRELEALGFSSHLRPTPFAKSSRRLPKALAELGLKGFRSATGRVSGPVANMTACAKKSRDGQMLRARRG